MVVVIQSRPEPRSQGLWDDQEQFLDEEGDVERQRVSEQRLQTQPARRQVLPGRRLDPAAPPTDQADPERNPDEDERKNQPEQKALIHVPPPCRAT
jgi:hypothetical protein